MALTRSLKEAEIQTRIMSMITNGRGYEPKKQIYSSSSITMDQLKDILRSTDTRSEWVELLSDPAMFPIIPPITDPDQRIIYHY
ncbi:MAG: hypothetical protein AABX10_04150 [Nanoarchaeota archaeon]